MKHIILFAFFVHFSFSITGQINTDSIRIAEESVSYDWMRLSQKSRPKLTAFVITGGYQYLDIEFNTYSEFAENDLLELNRMDHYLGLKLGGYYNSYYLEAGFYGGGAVNLEPYPKDALNSSSFAWSLNTNFGYGFPSRNFRTIFTPYMGLQYNQYNYFSQFGEYKDRLPLEEYMFMENFDISFKQYFSGLVGANFDVKLFSTYSAPYSFSGDGYLGIGVGYLFKMHKKPLIRSAGNELTSQGRLDLNGFFFQINFKIFLNER